MGNCAKRWARQDLSARARSIRPSRNPEVKDRGERARVNSGHPSLNPEVKYRGARAACPKVTDNRSIPVWI